MTKEIQQFAEEENTLIALLKFWGSCGFQLTKKLDRNNGKNLKLLKIRPLIQKIGEMKIKSGAELEEASKELANYINRDFLNHTFSYYRTSGNQTSRLFLKVVKAKLNSESKIEPDTFMSFWVRNINRYNEILENPMVFAGPGTGSLIGREKHAYLVVKVFEEFPVLETRNLCDPHEVLISSNDILNKNCVLNFIPSFIEPEHRVDQSSFFTKWFGKLKSVFK